MESWHPREERVHDGRECSTLLNVSKVEDQDLLMGFGNAVISNLDKTNFIADWNRFRTGWEERIHSSGVRHRPQGYNGEHLQTVGAMGLRSGKKIFGKHILLNLLPFPVVITNSFIHSVNLFIHSPFFPQGRR